VQGRDRPFRIWLGEIEIGFKNIVFGKLAMVKQLDYVKMGGSRNPD